MLVQPTVLASTLPDASLAVPASVRTRALGAQEGSRVGPLRERHGLAASRAASAVAVTGRTSPSSEVARASGAVVRTTGRLATPLVAALDYPSLLKRPAVLQAVGLLVGPVFATVAKHQCATSVLRPLVVDGVRVRARAAGQATCLEAGVCADPYAHTVHVRTGNVPVAHTFHTAAPVREIPSGARVPGVAGAAWPVGVDHEVPARERGANARLGARLPGAFPVNEAAYVPVALAAFPGAAPGVPRRAT